MGSGTGTSNDTKMRNILNEQHENDNEAMGNPLTLKECSSFCKATCRVCDSGRALEIQDLVARGMTYVAIAELSPERFGARLTPSSICRHMSNYREALRVSSTRQLTEVLDLEAETLNVHQARTLGLIKVAYENIITRYQQGLLDFSVDDLDKLTKLFYVVLQNPEQARMPSVINMIGKFDQKFGYATSMFDRNLNPRPGLQGGTNPPNTEDRNDAQTGALAQTDVPAPAPNE